MNAITTALQALGAALKVSDLLFAFLNTAKQNGEMTLEQEAEFDAHVVARRAMPHWQKSDIP